MKIIELHAHNVKRLTAVRITPTDAVTVVGGANGAGKSSVLDSIFYTLAGGRYIPEEPLRRGARSGKVVLRLDGDESRGLSPLAVTRTFTPKGGSLEIRFADGTVAPSPQKLLDDWRARFIDPLWLIGLEPRKQVEAMRELLGLDFASMDAEREGLYDERTIANRDVNSLQSRVRALPKREDAPDEEVSVAELSAELERWRAFNRDTDDARRDLAGHEKSHAALVESAAKWQHAVEKVKEQLVAVQASTKQATAQVEADVTALEERQELVAGLKQVDTSEVLSRIETAEEDNRKVRSNQQRATLAKQLASAEEKADDFSDRIEAIDTNKETLIQGAKWPVDGMGFNSSGLTWQGLPFEQAGSREQLRVSVAVGFAMNPLLPVLLVYGGSLLDAEGMRLIRELAEEHDGQVFIERVGDGDAAAIIIEDGHVREADGEVDDD